MKNIILIDKNKELLDYLRHTGINTIEGDILNQNGIILSASNPSFTMGAGLDKAIKTKYPELCKNLVKGKNQRKGNIIFGISVNEQLKATKELVIKSLKFARDNTSDDEDLYITGIGTGIGGLSYEDFFNCICKVFSDKVYWDCISEYQKLSETFIDEHKDKVYWDKISANQKLSEKFIYR